MSRVCGATRHIKGYQINLPTINDCNAESPFTPPLAESCFVEGLTNYFNNKF